ncbi:stage II sporulation protein M [[Clostridium] colinum]|uniref:stage II sporulation protein M n=1 Tax=[Clostridium] colinum TaxID=36835 RepID=UPI00202461DF|nr:stage II sporulation protein M [[Clostridium] colinum]
MEYLKDKYYGYKIKDNTLKNLMIVMFLGSILGSLFACLIKDSSIQKLDIFIDSFVTQNNSINFNFIYYFEVFFKGIKYFIFIWFLGFIPLGIIFIYLIVFSKGFFISFTTALFFNGYYLKGLEYIFNIYIIENIVVIILIFYISFKSINYFKNKRIGLKIDIKQYIKNLLVCIFINMILFYFIV